MGVPGPWLGSPPAELGLVAGYGSTDTGLVNTDTNQSNGSELPPIPTYAEVHRHPEVLTQFNRRVIEEFRANRGVVGGPFSGSDVLLLTMTGARTGRSRVTPLEYFSIGGRLLLVGSFGGAPKNPAWVSNLRADAAVGVEIGEQHYDARAQELPSDEAEALFAEIASRVPRMAGYPRPDRRIPMFELHRT